jgi:hypothetical protein
VRPSNAASLKGFSEFGPFHVDTPKRGRLPGEAEVHVSLATIKFQYLDWSGADSEYKAGNRAETLTTNMGMSYTPSICLFCGRFDEAAVEIKRARDIQDHDS